LFWFLREQLSLELAYGQAEGSRSLTANTGARQRSASVESEAGSRQTQRWNMCSSARRGVPRRIDGAFLLGEEKEKQEESAEIWGRSLSSTTDLFLLRA
jgi:hypothetical protein